MRILTLFGPNLNLLGLMTRTTGQRLTLDKVEQAVRNVAREMSVELALYQFDDELKACKILSRQRNKVDGLFLIPGIWNAAGRQLRETVEIIGKPLALYHLVPEGSPWREGDESLFSGIATISGSGVDENSLSDQFRQFVDHLQG